MSSSLPVQPFFQTPAQRTALARQRFFEEGARPSGLVSEAVIESWSRCLAQGQQPGDRPEFNPVSRSRVSAVLGRHQRLLAAAGDELDRLDQLLAGTRAKALLTDRQGLVIRCTPTERHEGHLIYTGTRVGVDLGEPQLGTTAPGVTARAGRACTVAGAEHFFAEVGSMHCVAAPIHDAHGQLRAVLDLSIEDQPFGFDAAGLVATSATVIENRLLLAQAGEHLVLRFHTHPDWLNTPLCGLAGVNTRGQLAWLNAAGARLLGALGWREQACGELIGLELAELLRRAPEEQARPFHTPAGLCLWGRVQLPWAESTRRPALPLPADPEPAPAPAAAEQQAAAPASLAERSRLAIDEALRAHGGNVSRAARALGVSRGLIYRRLREPGH